MSTATRPDKRLAPILDQVTEAVIALSKAEDDYRAALLAALDAGAGYKLTAEAAGVSRQAVRQFALRGGWRR